MDFSECAGMDSTFLGVLAGAALRLRKTDPVGSLILCELNERNLELVQNLGLNRLLTVDDRATAPAGSETDSLECKPVTDEVANARVVLEAHKNLIEADADNEDKFRDVLSFLKQQLGED